MNKISNNKGFTLIEVLIAMSIFVIFIGILINSYSIIIKSQSDANNYRAVYEEARDSFEILVNEFRDGVVDYGNIEYRCRPQVLKEGRSSVHLISRDALTKTDLVFDNGVLKMRKGTLPIGLRPSEDVVYNYDDYVAINSNTALMSDFKVYIYPYVDPYDSQYVFDNAYQFQPKVTFVATFNPDNIKFSSSVSSRLYNQVYPTTACK